MIYENVLRLCQRRGVSFREVERAAGLSNGIINSWKRKIPRVDKLLPVADYFGVTLDELVRGPEKKGEQYGTGKQDEAGCICVLGRVLAERFP